MIKELISILPRIPYLVYNDINSFDSLLINKYPPVIHRLSFKLLDDRTLFLHKLFNTKEDKALMHSHSWKFACKVLQGEYEMGLGYSEDRNTAPLPTFTTIIKPNDIYEMTDSNLWHYTKPTIDTPFSYSIMLVGPRCRERKAENNEKLSIDNKLSTLNWFRNHFNKD